jgi:fibronectin-binding autotransporter adhesin
MRPAPRKQNHESSESKRANRTARMRHLRRRTRLLQLEPLEARHLLATLTWVGGIDGGWNSIDAGNTNWASNQLPTSGDTLVFPAGPTMQNLTNDTAGGNGYILQFTGSGYTIGGNSIALTLAGTDIVDSLGGNTINAPLLLDGAGSDVEVTSGALSLDGTITGSGGLTKLGAGTLTLSNNNNAYGNTTIDGGVLRLTHMAASGTTGGVTVNATAVLELGGIGTYNRPLTLNDGSTLRGTGSSTYSLASNPVIANGATVSFATVDAGDQLNIGSGYANAGGSTVTPTININGPGMVALNSGSNSFRGNWNVQAGTLRVVADNAFGNPTVSGSLTGSTLTFNGGNLLIRSDSGRSFNGGSGTNLPVTVSANATITQQRATTGAGLEHNFGTLSIGGQTLTVTSETSVNSGAVLVDFEGMSTLTGNTTFNLVRTHASANQQIRFNGGITDGGVARTVTFNNTGGVAGEVIPVFSGSRTWTTGTQIDVTGNQLVRLIVNGPSATDFATYRIANTVTGNGSILDLRNNSDATFNNNLILDANAELRTSRSSSGAASTMTIGNITVNGNRTLITNGVGNLVSANSPYTFNAASVTLNGDATFNLPNNGSGFGTLTISGTIGETSGPRTFTKSGSGTLALNATATYTGATSINQGTVFAGADNVLSNAALTLGSGSTVATLDLATFDQTVTGFTVDSNSTSVNNLMIGAEKTLTVNGSVRIGTNAAASTNTFFTASGGGTLTVNNAASGASFVVGGATSSGGQGNRADADLSGLGAVRISLNPTNGLVRVNPANSNNVNGKYSTLKLPTTGAGNTTITASQLAIGGSSQNNGVAGQINAVSLGSGTNTINVNTINIGTGGRDVGELKWDSAVTTGSLVVRAANGTGRAAWSVGTGGANTGVGSLTGNLVDLSGHDADLLLSTLTIGSQNRNSNRTDTFTIDSANSSMDVTTVVVGTNSGTASGSAASNAWTSTLSIGGNTAVTIGTGGLDIANGNTAVTGADTISGNVNVSGGTVTVANNTVFGAAIRLGRNNVASGLTANGTLTITGGTVNVAGNIIKGVSTGAGSATVTLDGGTLDLAGRNITSVTDVNYRNGTLKNLGTVNTGISLAGSGTRVFQQDSGYSGVVLGEITGASVGLTKTGDGALDLQGANTYSGATNVNAGTLVVSGSLDAQASAVTVASGATLGGTSINRPLAVSGTLDPGAPPMAATGTMATLGGVSFTSGSTYRVQLGAVPAADLLTQVGGTINLTGASLSASALPGFTSGMDNVYTIVSATDDGAIAGTFQGMGESAQIPIAGQILTLSYSESAVTLTDTGTPAATTVYVNDNWSATTYGADPDGDGIVDAQYGLTAFSTIQDAINAVAAGATIVVAGGTYAAPVNVNKAVNFQFVVDTVTGQSSETIASIDDAVTLNAAPTFSDAGGPFTLGHIRFGETIDGAQPLDFTGSSSQVAFAGPVGNTTALTSLTTSAASTSTAIDTSVVRTSGDQTYNNPVTVDVAANLTASNVILGDVVVNQTLATTVSGTGSTITGVVSGPGGLTKSGTGKLTVSGDNTYTGKTIILSGTLSAGSLNSVGGGSASSNLGAPTTIANGTIDVGSGTSAGTLIYTGSGETSDRVLNLAGTTGGAVVEQSGAGLLKFTSDLTVTGSGAKNLILQGSTAGAGEIAGVVPNSDSGNTTVYKRGHGTWTLSGANTFSGLFIMDNGSNPTVIVTHPSGLGTNGIKVNSGVTNPTIWLHIDGSGSDGTISMPINFGGNSSITTNIDVNNNGGGNTNNIIQLNGPAGDWGSSVVLNVTGGNGYGLHIAGLRNTGGSAGSETFNPTTAPLTIGTLTGNQSSGTNTFILSGTHPDSAVTGVVSNSSSGAVSALTKSGSSTWNLHAANSYTGTTRIENGTLVAGTDNALSNAALILGTASTAGALDLSDGSQTITTLNVSTNSGTLVNTITIGSGKTLTNTGNVTVGVNSAASTATNLTVKGDLPGNGTWQINNVAASGTFQVGAATGGTNSNAATIDLSGLGTFYANLPGNTSVFRVGDSGTTGAAAGASTVILPPTSTITVNTLGIGDAAGAGSPMSLILGEGSHAIHANTINVANRSTGRSSGRLEFAGPTGTLTIRGQAGGTTAADLNIGVNSTTTGAAITGLVDLAGHAVDAKFATVTIGDNSGGTNSNGPTTYTHTFSFDTGTLLIDGTLTIGRKTGAAANAAVNGTVDFGGGQITVNSIAMAARTNTGAAVTGTLNITGGAVAVSGGISIANRTSSSGTATGVLNVTGGLLAVGGDIIESGNGNAATTLILDGGVLDVSGFAIGTSPVINTLHFRSGTLQNVGQINNGAAVSKTTAGTLTIAGTNTYAGATTVSDGTLVVTGSLADGPAPVDVTVNNAAVLAGSGTIAGAVTLNNTATLAPGVGGVEDLATGSLTLAATTNLAIEIDGSAPVTGHDQVVVTGNASLGGTLSVSGSYTPALMDEFTILQASGTVSGTFASPGATGTVLLNGWPLQVVYGGNTVTLSFDPSPAVNGTNADNVFWVHEDGSGNIVVVRDGDMVLSAPRANLTSLTINGLDGNDSLLVDYTQAGGFFDLPITFNGGNQSDSLSIAGGEFHTVTYNYTNAADGNIQLDLDGPGETTATVIAYTGLSPIANSGTAVNVIFNLPASSDNAVLEDDGTTGNNVSRLRSVNNTFEQTTFTNPSASLTVNAGDGNDTVTVASDFDSGAGSGQFNASLTIYGGVGTDIVHLNGALGLGSASATGDLTVTAEDIALGNTIGTNGNSLGAAGSVQLAGRILQKSTITIDTSSPGGDGNIVFNGPFFATDSSNNTLNLNAGTSGDIQFNGDVGGATFVESDGVVSGEAERYASRLISAAGGVWKLAPDEVLPVDSAVPIGNPTGGQYVQSLPDIGAGGLVPMQPPSILYPMLITNTGTYRLFLRSEADTPGGNADSIFVDIVELKDGTGGTIADWYVTPTASADQNFGSGTIWQGSGTTESTGSPSTSNQLTWNITAPGIYTLRIVPREDGAAVDKFVFQRTTATAPTGSGPAESAMVGPQLNIVSARNVNGGTIQAVSVTQSAGTGTTTLTGPVTATGAVGISLTGTNFAISGGMAASSGPIAITHTGPNSLDVNTGAVTSAGGLAINATTAGTTGTISSAISGSGGLTKQGDGSLTLSGNSTYGGATTIGGGTLRARHDNALGTSAGSLDAGILEIAGVAIGNSLSMAHGTMLRGTGPATYSSTGNLVIASGATVTFATIASDDQLNIDSGYSNAGGSTVTPTVNISGPGTVALNSGSSSFRGHWNVQSGTLRVTGNAGAFGNPAVSGSLIGSTLTLAGGDMLVQSNAAVTYNAGGAAVLSVTVSADAIITVQRATSGAAYIIQFGPLSIGSSTLMLTNDSSVTSGDMELRFNDAATLTGDPAFNVTRGVAGTRPLLRLSGITDGGMARTITMGNTGSTAGETLVLIGAARTLQSGTRIDLAGNQLFRYIAEGVSANDNAAVRFTNTAQTGVYEVRNSTGGTFNNNLVLDANGEIRSGRLTSGSGVTHTLGTLTVNGNRTLVASVGNAVTINSAYGLSLGAATLNGNAVFSVNNNGTGIGTLTVSGAMGETGGTRTVTKSGSGTLALANEANSYSGATTTNAGVLSVSKLADGGSVSSIGTSGSAAANLIISGGILRYTGTGDSSNRLFTLGTGTANTLDASGSGALSLTNTGAIAFTGSGARTLTLTGSNTGGSTLASVLGNGSGGNVSLTKSGGGTWILTNANTHAGTTTIGGIGGILRITHGSALGTAAGNTVIQGDTTGGATLELAGGITVAEPITIEARQGATANADHVRNLSGDNTLSGAITGSTGGSAYNITATAGSLTFTNTLNNSNSGSRNLNLRGAATGIVDGNITGTWSLLKHDAGIWTLAGANTYSGPTTVNAGTLLVNGSTVAASAVTVATAGTLGGTGNIFGTVTLNGNAAVAPGTLTTPLTGRLGTASVTFAASPNVPKFQVEIGGTAAGQYDQLKVTGTVNLGGARLVPSLVNAFVPDSTTVLANLQQFPIIDNDGDHTDPVIGVFRDVLDNSLPEGSPVTVGTTTLYISYRGGDGNDVVLSTQPLMNGTSLADTFTLTGDGTNFTVVRENSAGTVSVTYFDPPVLTILGAGADDLLIVDLTGGADAIPAGGVNFDGQAHDFPSRLPGSLGDVLQVRGSGTETATYLPDGVPGPSDNDGTVTVAGQGVIHFFGLEPVDLIDMAVANVHLPSANDVVNIVDGFDAATGTLAALVASGTSGGVPFESVHLRGNAAVVIDTVAGGSDGNDTVTIHSGTGAHGNGNLTIDTGAGTDAVNVSGSLTVGGDIDISSHAIAFVGGTLTAGAINSVTLHAGSGAISSTSAVVAVVGRDLLALATAGIGDGDAIETQVSMLEAFSTGGNVMVDNTGALTIGGIGGLVGVSASAGSVAISATGALNVDENVTASGSVLLAAVEGGAADHLTVKGGTKVESTGSSVTVQAGDNLTLADCSTLRAAGTISLYGDYGSNDSAGSVMQLLGTLDAGAGNDNVLVFGGPQADVITVNPGGTHSADSMVIDGGEGDDRYHIYLGKLTGGLLAVTIADGGTTSGDQAFVYGTVGDDVLTVHNNDAVGTNPQTGGFVHLPERSVAEPAERVNYSASLNFLTVDGGAGNDLFHVQPSQTAVIAVEGGAPGFGPGAGDVPQVAGDTLDFDSYNNTFHIVCGTIHTNDELALPNNGTGPFQPVHYRNIENMPLDPLGSSEPLRFDMDWNSAGTQGGYNSVLPTAVYNASDPLSKFGWDAPLNGFDRGTTSFTSDFANLLRDGHWHSAPRTFIAEVESGWYLVSVKTGDKSFARDRLRVTDANTVSEADPAGRVLLDNVSSPAGQIVERTFLVFVPEGQNLALTFANLGGDPYWVVNGIEIRPGRILTFGSPETDAKWTADGVTQTTFTGYQATPGALVTVDPQLDTQGDYLPEGTVTILGVDADPDVAGHQVRAGADGVFTYTIVHPSVAGTMRVMYAEVTGAQASCFSVDFVAPSVRRFDFNSGASPTQAPAAQDGTPNGYVGVLPTQLSSPAVGYGWVTAAQGFDRGALSSPAYSNLLRDGAWSSSPRDFRMQLPAGTYDVTVTFGDASFARDQMNVTVVTGSVVSDLANVTNVATAAGQFVHRSFKASPDGGELVLRFSDGGGDPYWTVNAVEVRPSTSVKPLSVARAGGNAAQPADGTTDTFTMSNATAGAWYTVSTDMGQVATADADPRYAGVQIQVPESGTFEFTVRRGTAVGTAAVRVEEVNGASRGYATQAYAYAPVRRFDFNGSGADNETGFWNIRGSDVFDPAAGYGWNAAVSEFQRSTAGISEPQLAALYRDGHWQSAPRTFQVGVDPNKTYDVRIHTGDRSFARDELQVTVEGIVAPQSPVATAANEFETITVLSVTPSGDGILDIRIANLGGDPYWVINGIEVAESGQLPDLPEPEAPEESLSRRFDFGTSSSPFDPNFTQVGATNAFDPVLGYGWTTAAPTFNRGITNPLLRDGHWGTNNTFSVQVPAAGSEDTS